MYHWNWSVLWATTADGTSTYLGTLLMGLGWTLVVGLSAWVIALLIGAAVGIARTFPSGFSAAGPLPGQENPPGRQRTSRSGEAWGSFLARAAAVYVECLRSVPLIVQMFLWFYVAPDLLPSGPAAAIKAWDKYNIVAAIICLALFTSARVAEQIRAGIQAIPRGQIQAARALGMGTAQAYRYVLVPVAFRKILPALTNEFVNIIKNSSVAFTIAVVELMAATRSMQEMTFQVFEAFTAATIIYLAVNLLVVQLMNLIERRLEVPGLSIRKAR